MAEHRIGVVGGGILGVAIAREVVRRRPGTEVVVLEKEDRLAAHHRMFENAVSGADFRVLLDYGIGPNIAIWADFHVIFDDSCRMDRHLPGFEDNRVLWILQILFMMHRCCGVFD